MPIDTHGEYQGLRALAERGRKLESAGRPSPEPYPQRDGPAPSLPELRKRRAAIEDLAARHRVRALRVFGSVARGEQTPHSDLDVLVDIGHGGLLAQAALQADLEELLGCPVHTLTASGLRRAHTTMRDQIENDARAL